MKNYIYSFTVLILVTGLIAFTVDNSISGPSYSPTDHHFEIPDNVMQVVDKSCYGCHNSESQNDKGKKKLMFDKLGELKTYKLVGKLSEMADVVANDEMPPEKFLAKKPEAAPTAVEKKILIDWAENTAKQLSE